MIKIFSLLLLFISCSSEKAKLREAVVEESWKGRSSSDLLHHSFFKSLPLFKKVHEDGSETWVFHDQSRFQTKAYCDSLGGCLGMPIYNCDYAFTLVHGIVQKMEKKGTCRAPNVISPDASTKGSSD